MVVLAIAVIPTIEFSDGDGDVVSRETTSSMESLWIDMENTDTAARRFTVRVAAPGSDAPVNGVRVLPDAMPELDGGENRRVLIVFQAMQPGELREAEVCYAPQIRPQEATCTHFAIKRL
ncbi:hypothetical protein [Croceicoccus sediminis]|uniref:hypothetical protein n=1 Tax=Croceicoccus sediminis TaxID=2571150 RepID=UPI00118290E6|nr:hypothetical protein [Croceicoccus sediminis]